VSQVHLAQERNQWQAVKPSSYTKGGELLYHLSDYWLVKNDGSMEFIG
jgi:hypothetical protein